jgi:hypothetical protein
MGHAALLVVGVAACTIHRGVTESSGEKSATALPPPPLDLRTVAPRVLVDLTPNDSAARVLIVGALLLPNGRVAAAEAESQRLIYYDPGGNPVTTIPLQTLGVRAQELIRVSVDTVALTGIATAGTTARRPQGAAVVFTGTGQLVRRFNAADVLGDLPQGMRLVLGILGGGRTFIGVVGQHSGPAPGQSRWVDSITIAAVGPDMRITRVFDPLPEYVLALEDSQPRQVWFAPSAVVASTNSALYYGFGGEYAIAAISATGETTRVITRPWQRVTVTDADILAYIDGWGSRWITSTGAEAEAQKRQMRSDPFFEYVPAFSQFLASASGELWVRTPNLIDAQGNGELSTVPLVPSNWSVFDQMGRWRGTAMLPARFFPTDAGSDYVLGVEYGTGRSRKLVAYDLPKEWTATIR